MDIEQRRELVERFLRRCIKYSDASIKRKISRSDSEIEIARWQAYREFTAYSADEISSGSLDTWLENGDISLDDNYQKPSLEDQLIELKIEDLDHDSRRQWLAQLLMPRPVVIISTIGQDGVENLSAISSLNIISNSPPLLSMSLSIDDNGRPRDTMVNLQNHGKDAPISVAILRADHRSALNLDAVANSIPHSESEWGLIDATPIESKQPYPPLISNAIAALECKLVQMIELPEGAKGTLAIMRVENIVLPEKFSDEMLSTKLFQIDFANLGPGPDQKSWRFPISNWIQNFESDSGN
ncbi:MAG: hypothetical protein HN534_00480 [Euryarchaeota archaeon]|jgi:flavin reductase (DIM6/NTAB) family NADH-FMN oxidoreductase RutF|nr:hypothetical protein [Euryarchaeota archaeon]MBT3653397.1 hypothetical protein [Euryarchaeota archaeon]MBT3758265.1 hypothetical protein [Euryarchaeota archaeon]MBT4051374.1 hypothetical protein [Euryarchaeota archaeon]MBT4346000.1 hypothetical protein [Euryarchaeota archaeon]